MMYTEEDLFVVIVAEKEVEDLDTDTKRPPVQIKSEPEYSTDSIQVDDLLEAAEKHGENISIKIEGLHDYEFSNQKPNIDDYEYEYLEDDLSQRAIKLEVLDADDVSDSDKDNEADVQRETEKHKSSMLKPRQQKSLVAELSNEYSDLRDDEELLVNTLELIMRTVKPPPPPENYYVELGDMYECTRCGAHTKSKPAAARHYQERHGTRYLVCFACGVDFRSTTNLYKHEKRCMAPDARIVLRARGAYLGRKGRSRPFMQQKPFTIKSPEPKRAPDAWLDRKARSRPLIEQKPFTSKPKITFPCDQCSAVFRTAATLEAHDNLHRGKRPYRCHACPAAYTSAFVLKRHERGHTDQFICDHCSRSFKSRAAVVSHMNTHNPIRKFGCVKCDRRFAGKSALVLHKRRVHLGLPPPFACQICPRRYPRMSLLKDHMKKAHGLTIITRNMFLKALPTMSEFEIKNSKLVFKTDQNAVDHKILLKTEVGESLKENVEKYEENSNQSQTCYSEG